MKKIASTFLFLTVLTAGLLAEEKEVILNSESVTTNSAIDVTPSPSRKSLQDGITSGSIKAGIEVRDTEGKNKYSIRRTIADGFITNSNWDGFRVNYLAFRDVDGGQGSTPVTSEELGLGYDGKLKNGGWGASIGFDTEYNKDGLTGGLTFNHRINEISSIFAMAHAKKIEGGGEKNTSLDAAIFYNRRIGEGFGAIALHYTPKDQKIVNENVIIYDPNLIGVKVEYGRHLTKKLLSTGYLEYETGEETGFANIMNGNHTDFETLKVGVTSNYRIDSHFSIESRLEQRFALVDRDVQGAKASTDESWLALAIAYNY